MAREKKQWARMTIGPMSPIKVTKKKKDENTPKRALSAYMLWLAENRSRLTKPGMSVTDVSKVWLF